MDRSKTYMLSSGCQKREVISHCTCSCCWIDFRIKLLTMAECRTALYLLDVQWVQSSHHRQTRHSVKTPSCLINDITVMGSPPNSGPKLFKAKLNRVMARVRLTKYTISQFGQFRTTAWRITQ